MANIDTLAYYEELRKAGDSELEAKAHVYALSKGISDLITKDDLHNELAGLESRMDSKMDSKFAIVFAELKTIRTLGWALFVGVMVPVFKLAFWP